MSLRMPGSVTPEQDPAAEGNEGEAFYVILTVFLANEVTCRDMQHWRIHACPFLL